jgi:hypothetical protein
MSSQVRFFTGTKEQYLSLADHNPLGLYFCENTNELFWGDRCISDGIRVVPTHADLPECSCAADGVVYYVTETRNGYTLSPDRTEWLQTIYAPITDAYTVPESEIYNTVTTVGAVRDIEKAIYTYVDKEIAGVEVGDGVDSINFAGVSLTEVDGVFSIDKESAREALGIYTSEESVPEGEEEKVVATVATVNKAVDDLKTYVEEQVITGGTGTLDGGEI